MSQSEIWQVSKAVILSIGGAGAVLFALAGFLSKVWAERILSNEKQKLEKEMAALKLTSSELLARLQGFIDRAQHVNRATFDREFGIYQVTWGKIVDLRAAVLSLRPISDHRNPNQSEEDRKQQRLNRLYEGLRAFWDAYERNRPFYPQKIYEECTNLVNLTRKEEAQYRFDHPNHDFEKYWSGVEESSKNIVASCDKICDLIRGRIAELSSIPQGYK